MNAEQIRHAKAMARKIAGYAQRILSSMESISLDDSHLEYIPVKLIQNKFLHDSGFGVQDNLEGIQSVIKDMIEGLIEKEHKNDDEAV